MKIEQDDPRWIAYVLGELSAKEAKQFDHAIAGDPALKLALKEIERSQTDLLKFLGTESDTLLPRQRSAIMQAAREASGPGKIVSMKPQRKEFNIWAWPLAAAAVVTATMFIVTMLPAPETGDSDKKVGNGSIKPSFDEFVAVENRGQARKSIALPLIAGNKSLTQITRSIRELGNLPSRQDVRIEEMLNAFPLDTNGSVALLNGASLGAEVVECPWSPSGSLVFVKIRGARDRSSKLSVEFNSNDRSVISSRLLGYEIEENTRDRKSMPQELSAGQETLVAILIEAKSQDLGQLVWSVDGQTAPMIELVRDSEKEASSDSRFASLICGFGLWLREEKPEIIDDPLILGLAREVAAESLVPDRYNFLTLVDQAVKAKSK
jgi:hypothetical protein